MYNIAILILIAVIFAIPIAGLLCLYDWLNVDEVDDNDEFKNF